MFDPALGGGGAFPIGCYVVQARAVKLSQSVCFRCPRPMRRARAGLTLTHVATQAALMAFGAAPPVSVCRHPPVSIDASSWLPN